jgi:hypothetical protein
VNYRETGRLRTAIGALLLLATVVTWATGFMMSPHGQTVVQGTEHLRPTIVTFKRNAAIGTLISCALAIWLLFPRVRPKWAARDWALAVLLILLSGSSVYTLISLPSSAAHTANAGDLAVSGMNDNLVGGGPAADLNAPSVSAAPPPGMDQLATRTAVLPPLPMTIERFRSSEQRRSTAQVMEKPADTARKSASSNADDEPADNETAENQE